MKYIKYITEQGNLTYLKATLVDSISIESNSIFVEVDGNPVLLYKCEDDFGYEVFARIQQKLELFLASSDDVILDLTEKFVYSYFPNIIHPH